MFLLVHLENKKMNSNFINFKYDQLGKVMMKLRSLEHFYTFSNILEGETDNQKIFEDLSKALQQELNLEELASIYIAVIMLVLQTHPEIQNRHLELLNHCLSYSDMLKPTMIDYVTRELIYNAKYAASINDDCTEYDYMLYLLWPMPHIIIGSETGKMISLGLLRAFIAELTNTSPIVMHIYRNILEIWQMIKTLNVETVVDNWNVAKIYTLLKSFNLILATAGLNRKNAALKQAGFRGFELPQTEVKNEISEWFKRLRNLLEEKQKAEKSNFNLMLAQFIDCNILIFLLETTSEIASEPGN